MIAKICGRVAQKNKDCLILDVNGICYEVFLPQAVMQRIDENITPDGCLQLITYHYHHIEPSRATPVLIGFLNQIEKDFFQDFISVSGIGPRAALKAINRPISEIAQAIDEANFVFLRSLPGIGMQRAKDIIAKLQGKVGKYGLIQDKEAARPGTYAEDLEAEALQVLMQLQYKKPEAKEMIQKALARSPGIQTTEELLNEVYKQKLHPHK